MRISIIWTWYIWLIQAVWLAKLGFEIISVDVFEDKINKLKNGEVTIYEEWLEELLKETWDKINFTTDISQIKWSEIIFICVWTPQDNSGKTDLAYIFWACRDIKDYLTWNEIIVIKSTVPVWTNKKVYEFLDKKNEIVSNPEFLREWIAVNDFFNPDRIVLGFRNLKNNELIEKIKKVYLYFIEKNIPLIITDWQTSELIKYSANSFLATKITFINEIARLADKSWANIKDISKAIWLDERIWSKFLNAWIGYGGSCFPKDVKSLIHQFKENDLEWWIISKVDETNDSQVDYFIDKILEEFSQNLHSKIIWISWISFKPWTDDLRESRWLEIVKKLLFLWAKIKVFDYTLKARENFSKFIEWFILSSSRWFYPIEICESFEDLTKNIDFLIIANEDKNILKENFEKLNLMDKIIFDWRNILDKEKIESLGIKYVGVGV